MPAATAAVVALFHALAVANIDKAIENTRITLIVVANFFLEKLWFLLELFDNSSILLILFLSFIG